MTEPDGYPPPVPGPSESQLLASANTMLPESRRQSSYQPYVAPKDEFSIAALGCVVLAIAWTALWVVLFSDVWNLVMLFLLGNIAVVLVEAGVAEHLKKDRPRGRVLPYLALIWTVCSSLYLLLHAEA